jgi:hypothetical protein
VGLKLQVPSEREAAVLDRVRDDLEWLYVANISLARIHQLSGRETLARESLPHFVETIATVLDDCRDRYRYARYSSDRAQFWEVRAVALRALPEPQNVSIELEFDVQEIKELILNHEPPEA